MNRTIARLTKLGYKVYATEVNTWRVWQQGSFVGVYSDRELIKFGRSVRSQNWRPAASSKSNVGCGGKWCTCCTKAPPSVLKKWERRAARRQSKKYSPFEDSMEYHDSFA